MSVVSSLAIVSGQSKTLLSATGTGASATTFDQKDFARHLKFSAESDSSHTGTTTIEVRAYNGSSTDTVGVINVTGNSDSAYFLINGSIGTFDVNCSAHGDSTNTVTVRMEW